MLDGEQLDIYPSAHIEVDIDKKTLRILQEGKEGFTGELVSDQWTRIYGDERPPLHIQCRNSAGVEVAVLIRPSDETDEHEARQMVDQFLRLFALMGGHIY
jgi:hypothetical protein